MRTGIDPFGSWDAETLEQSLAMPDGEGRAIGAVFNQTMGPFDVEPPLRE